MANTALEALKKENSAKMAAQNKNFKTKQLEASFFRKGFGILTAATYGTLNRLNVSKSVGWFPWKIAVTTVALIVEGTTSGKVQASAAGVGEATNAIYVASAITENTLIVGRELGQGAGRRQVTPGGGGGAL